jgi:hypothetical protein
MRVFEGDPREHADELIATNACDHVVGAQACAERIRYGDKQRVPSSMASRVIRRLETIDVDVGSHELPAGALRPIDLAPNGCQPSATPAGSGQLVGTGILTVLGRLGAIFGRNLAVVDGLSAILGRHLAVVDCPHAAVRGLSAARGRQDSLVCRALTVVRRAIACRAVEIANRVVTCFRLLVAQPGRNVTVLCSEPGLAPPYRGQLVGSGVLAVLGSLGAIFCSHPAVIDRSNAAVRSLGAPRVSSSTFVIRALAIARRAIARGSVAISRRVVTRLGFLVTELGGIIALPRCQSSLATARCRQLVGPGVLAVLGRLRTIVRCDPAIVDGPDPTVRCLGAPRCGSSPFICCSTAIGCRPIARRTVEIARGIVTTLRFPVAQLGCDIARARSQRGVFAISGGLYTIFGRKLAVVDGLCAVVRSLGASSGGLRTFVRRVLAVARGAVPRGSVEVTGRVVTCFGLSITQPGRHVAVLSGLPGFTPAHSDQLIGPGIKAVFGGMSAIFGRDLAVVDGLGTVVRGSGASRGSQCSLVSRILPIAERAIAGGSVEVTGGVISSFGLAVAQPRGDVAILRSQPRLAAAHSSQLVGPRILTVFGGLRSVFGGNLAVVDGLSAVVCSLVVRRGSAIYVTRRASTFACRPIP